MDNYESGLIRSYLIGRVIVAITLAASIMGSIWILATDILSETDSNDALNAILGALTLALGQALTGVVGAMSRDVTEHIERMKAIRNADADQGGG